MSLEHHVGVTDSGIVGHDSRGNFSVLSIYDSSTSDEEFIERATRVARAVFPKKSNLFRKKTQTKVTSYCDQYCRGFRQRVETQNLDHVSSDDLKTGITTLDRWFQRGWDAGGDYLKLPKELSSSTIPKTHDQKTEFEHIKAKSESSNQVSNELYDKLKEIYNMYSPKDTPA